MGATWILASGRDFHVLGFRRVVSGEFPLPGFYCLEGGNDSQFAYMNETILWPDGEFTIQDAITRNANMPQTAVREELAAAIKAKRIVQTRKGTHRVKGKFKVVQEPTSNV